MKEKAQEIRRWLRLKIHSRFIVILILFSFSCQQTRKEEVEFLLTGGGRKHWLLITEYPEVRYRGKVYNKNGTYIVYSEEKNVRWLDYGSTWKLLNDSIIEDGRGTTLRIDYINEDVLIISNISFKGTSLYFKSKDQETVPIKDTTNYQNKI